MTDSEPDYYPDKWEKSEPHPNYTNRGRPKTRPDGISRDEWKNRFKVWSVLKEPNWHLFHKWLKVNNLSVNRGINVLIQTHPDIQKNA